MNKEFEKKYNELKSITTSIFRIYYSLINEDFDQKDLLDILNLLLEKESKIYETIDYDFDRITNFIKYINVDNENQIVNHENLNKIEELDLYKPFDFYLMDIDLVCNCSNENILIKRRMINNLKKNMEKNFNRYIESIKYNRLNNELVFNEYNSSILRRRPRDFDESNKTYLYGKNEIIYNINHKCDILINLSNIKNIIDNFPNEYSNEYLYYSMAINKDIEEILLNNNLNLDETISECNDYYKNLSDIEKNIYDINIYNYNLEIAELSYNSKEKSKK